MTSFGNVAKLGIFKAKGIVFEKWSVWGKTYIIKKQGEKIIIQKKTSITYWTHDRTILKISQPSGKKLPLGQNIKLQTT